MQENIETTNTQIENTAVKAVPVQKQERIETLDIIRGVALLGILLVHMPLWFGTPHLYLEFVGQSPEWTGWNRLTEIFVSTFASAKFFPIFSFLFGLGFFIFFERAKERNPNPKRLFRKRLFFLMLIGFAHAFLIWWGDILVSYALFGFLLPLFFDRKPKTLLIWIGVFFILTVFFTFFGVITMLLQGMHKEVTATEMPAVFTTFFENRLESSIQAYRYGTFGEIMRQRASDTLFVYAFMPFNIIAVFPMFLLGLYAGKKGIFQNIESNLPFIKKAWKWSFAIAIPMSIAVIILQKLPNTNIYLSLSAIAGFFSMVGLVVFYITSITLLCQNAKWLLRLKPFAYVGRMALSNYLLQSIIGTLIFYNYGLGLYGQIAPAFGMVLALVIFAVQIFISKWWLERYQFGPMEWTWKSLTYGKRFKNKVQN